MKKELVLFLLILLGCSSQQKKEYIKSKVVELYLTAPRNPMDFLASSLTEGLGLGTPGSLQSIGVHMTLAQDSMNRFNRRCSEVVSSDPMLKKYFESLITEIPNREREPLSVENLNYFGVIVRKSLEMDLKVDIID